MGTKLLCHREKSHVFIVKMENDLSNGDVYIIIEISSIILHKLCISIKLPLPRAFALAFLYN
jgi:hypothetical protein